MNPAPEIARALLPLTILGGYLGSGKTTLVNHLLRNANGLKLAVLVNEFGDLPIDQDLIEAQGDDLISIAGGCVCCSYGNDLTLALIDLANMDPRPDHVILEASGVAIPGAISAAINLLPGYRTDGIVLLADAETIRTTAADRYMGDTVLRQLADADLILLNKCDLVDQGALDQTRSWLTQQKPEALIVETVRAIAPPQVVMDSFLDRPRDALRLHLPDEFESRTLYPAPPKTATDLAQVLASESLGLVRAKGFVTVANGTRHLIQVVGRRWQTSPARPKTPDAIVCLGLDNRTDWNAVEALGLSAGVE